MSLCPYPEKRLCFVSCHTQNTSLTAGQSYNDEARRDGLNCPLSHVSPLKRPLLSQWFLLLVYISVPLHLLDECSND